MTNEIIIEKLKKLIFAWSVSADSQRQMADYFYNRESIENKYLHFAANAQINCSLDIDSFIEELELEQDDKEIEDKLKANEYLKKNIRI
jgi:hypothetical protein